MKTFIPTTSDIYLKKYYGITGKIGDGDNTEIYFLQTSLKMQDLEEIKLLIDIPGSEKWGVKDLFQRLVNRERLTKKDGLINYFKDKNQVKYFNPIALALLPIKDNEIEKELHKLKQEEGVKDEQNEQIDWTILTKENVFKFYFQNIGAGNIGKLEWNKDNCYVVAIDGQHRLTALRELYDSRFSLSDNITNWQIPVVFIVPNKIMESEKAIDFIALIRKIFMYINMKAEKVSDSRLILLNDESIECLCVQGVVEAFHENDVTEKEKNNKYPPLFLIDWLGVSKDATVLRDSRYLFSNIELRNWMKHYLIGEDLGISEGTANNQQRTVLGLIDLDLDSIVRDASVLSNEDSVKIRNQFNSKIRDAFIEFLTNLIPLKEYINACREYEKENSIDIYQKQVFNWLRYNHSKFENKDKVEYDNYKKIFVARILELKKEYMSEFFRQDICLRGFVYAYSEIYEIYKTYKREPIEWMDYTKIFLNSFNKLIEDDWCEDYLMLDDSKRELLIHICHDDSGRRINYKLEDVKNAWGIFIIMSVLNYATQEGIIDKNCKVEIWENYRDRLKSSLEKGFRIVIKREKDQEKLSAIERNRIINEEKELKANMRIEELEDLWEIK